VNRLNASRARVVSSAVPFQELANAPADPDWRKNLIDALARRQRPDGSWINENKRWLEGDANLSTGYALLALSYCKK